jgi:hypothetical protein
LLIALTTLMAPYSCPTILVLPVLHCSNPALNEYTTGNAPLVTQPSAVERTKKGHEDAGPKTMRPFETISKRYDMIATCRSYLVCRTRISGEGGDEVEMESVERREPALEVAAKAASLSAAGLK